VSVGSHGLLDNPTSVFRQAFIAGVKIFFLIKQSLLPDGSVT
jgi:hypothetical protein